MPHILDPIIISLPKPGHSDRENEDAWAGPVTAGGAVRWALSDGATESVFSGVWAKALANCFARGRSESVEELRQEIAAAAAGFDTGIGAGEAVPWYLEEKLQQGAHAAFLGLHIRFDGTWSSFAVGDSCILQIRDAELYRSWPLDDTASFDSRPVLVGSERPPEPSDVQVIHGTWRVSDIILMATDAVAAWLLSNMSRSFLTDLMYAPDAALQKAREDGEIRSDDHTLIVLRFD